MTVKVELRNLDETIRRIDGVQSAVANAAKNAYFDPIQQEFLQQAQEYPAEGPWNKPGPHPSRWYARGFGPRWTLARTSAHGGKRTSERLGNSWAAQNYSIGAFVGGNRQSVGGARAQTGTIAVNTASYAKYVHGDKDQSKVMRSHGWKTVGQILSGIEPFIARQLKALADEISQAWNR